MFCSSVDTIRIARMLLHVEMRHCMFLLSTVHDEHYSSTPHVTKYACTYSLLINKTRILLVIFEFILF